MTLEEIEQLSLGEVRELAWRQDMKLRTYQSLLDAIPPCPAHGAGCIAFAIQWATGMAYLEEVLSEKERQNA